MKKLYAPAFAVLLAVILLLGCSGGKPGTVHFENCPSSVKATAGKFSYDCKIKSYLKTGPANVTIEMTNITGDVVITSYKPQNVALNPGEDYSIHVEGTIGDGGSFTVHITYMNDDNTIVSNDKLVTVTP